jgi:type III secretion protein K
MDLMQLALRQQLHPELDMHPSWLPAAWPVRHRRLASYNGGGQAVVSQLVQRLLDDAPASFDTPLRRLALLDGPSLRRLAAYTGLCAHKPLLQARATGRQLRRQAARLDSDGADFVVRRMPELSELRMNLQSLQQRPISIGRVVANRGYRLLAGTLASDGDTLLRRVQLKLPRRVAATPPALTPRQVDQLRELMLMCIVPERLRRWDWLF